MENASKKNVFLEWFIYSLALICLGSFVYIFSIKNTTALTFDDKIVNQNPNIVSVKPIEVKDSTSHNNKAEVTVAKPEKVYPSYKKVNNSSNKKVKKTPKKKTSYKKTKHSSKIKKSKSNYIKYAKPVRVLYKNYNWTVLNRYSVTPNKVLYRSGHYIIKTGDNVSRIAARFKVKAVNIIAINKFSDPDQLSAGGKIYIPNR